MTCRNVRTVGSQPCHTLSSVSSNDGAGQQCCYDIDGYLMMTSDSMWGGNPHRAHNLGMRPFYEANKVRRDAPSVIR